MLRKEQNMICMQATFLLIIILLFTVSCTAANIEQGNQSQRTEGDAVVSEGTVAETPPANLAEIKANEAGKVMILMYHVIGAEKEGAWSQTAEKFRRDLLALYEQGYSLIGLNDFLNNNITTPAGKSPVIITFDDGSPGHFRYLEGEGQEQEIDPQSAVGIMLDFAAVHPGFGSAATFFINDRPFGAKQDWRGKMKILVELGFELGNHTLTHPRLDRILDVQVQKELAGLAKLVEENVPAYQVQTLALPFGIMPANPDLAVQGSYEEYDYVHKAVLRVGANPALSPNRKGYDPYRLPRVQASTAELEKWLKYFVNNPAERYISDGDPQTIAVPKEKKDLIFEESLAEKTLLVWE
jgi:hypothetical protein